MQEEGSERGPIAPLPSLTYSINKSMSIRLRIAQSVDWIDTSTIHWLCIKKYRGQESRWFTKVICESLRHCHDKAAVSKFRTRKLFSAFIHWDYRVIVISPLIGEIWGRWVTRHGAVDVSVWGSLILNEDENRIGAGIEAITFTALGTPKDMITIQRSWYILGQMRR